MAPTCADDAVGTTLRARTRVAAVVMLILLVACSHDITVDVRPPEIGTGADAAAVRSQCVAIINAMPETLALASRVSTAPVSELTAAWAAGGTAITISCGLPVRHAATESLLVVDGIQWRTQAHANGTAFTAVDRSVSVVLTVPRALMPAAAYLTSVTAELNAFSRPIN